MGLRKKPLIGRLFSIALLALALVLVSKLASAHSLRTTSLAFDMGERVARAELQLPLDQLELALQKPVVSRAQRLVAEDGPQLAEYVEQHLRVEARDGRPFAVTIETMRIETVDDAPSLVVRLLLRPPEAAPANTFRVHCDVIEHYVVPHKILVSVRRDFTNGIFADAPKMVDILGFQHEDVEIDQSRGSPWTGFKAVFTLGMRHIREGSDHLLFLLVMLLPAPLLATGGRWGERAPVKQSLRGIAMVVTAFTLGHSLTLALAAFGLVRLPSRPVEIVIALSILVSAVHAMWPLFARREPLVAGSFGLVHGLAFATVLTDMGLDSQARIISLLGFNLGIEVMQLVVISLVIPWLLLWGRSPSYVHARTAGALCGALAACGWIAERAFHASNPIGPIVDATFANDLVIVGILAAVVTVSFVLNPRRRPS